jgi:hypothetical protein
MKTLKEKINEMTLKEMINESTCYKNKKASLSVDGKTRLWLKNRFRLKNARLCYFSIGCWLLT